MSVWRRAKKPRPPVTKAPPAWVCIVCGANHATRPEQVDREGCQCTRCGATWRNRATVLGVALGLGVPVRPLPRWRTEWGCAGVGFDDAPLVAARLGTRLSFTNTHLGRFPQLDLIDPVPAAVGQFRFAICSDVLEHVEPPVDRGFLGLGSILRPDGFAVVSVPIGGPGETTEHYPDLVEYRLLEGPRVQWRDTAGRSHLDEDPEMHGGTGLVLAFRLFGHKGFVESLYAAGFPRVVELPAHPELGVFELPNAGIYIAHRQAAQG